MGNIVGALNQFTENKGAFKNSTPSTQPMQYSLQLVVTQPTPVVTPVVTPQPTTSSVTSHFLQELVAPLPEQDQSAIMALFYTKPQIVQDMVRDIPDSNLLRSTLLQVAKQ